LAVSPPSGATDEVGALWRTATHDVPTTYVTVLRDDDQVAYARLSDNGTGGPSASAVCR
jgi:hypothetical protein